MQLNWICPPCCNHNKNAILATSTKAQWIVTTALHCMIDFVLAIQICKFFLLAWRAGAHVVLSWLFSSYHFPVKINAHNLFGTRNAPVQAYRRWQHRYMTLWLSHQSKTREKKIPNCHWIHSQREICLSIRLEQKKQKTTKADTMKNEPKYMCAR